MLTQFSRTGLLIGENGIDRLRRSRVAVFGIGGVGGYVCEATMTRCASRTLTGRSSLRERQWDDIRSMS